QVLKTCAEFIEKHGIVDGIYRLSGITSNIQRLRQEFCSELSPELTREIYLQDIHCVGSLCKLYFRELPNPLLTFELYKKFMDAVSVQEEHVQLEHIQNVINELPPPHYRTLEYLVKHLVYMATFSSQTNMHARNLALVWAPNLLRSKETELHACNGDTAFLEVRVQQIVVEFILNHVEQIFNCGVFSSLQTEGLSLVCEAKCATLPTSSQCTSMKLMSLEEAQARSIDQRHPAHRDHQLENSAPDTSNAALYHTIIDLPDSRMFSGKSKKWKSIFNLGRSVTDSKGKQSRSASVFVKAQTISERDPFRTRKSMDSLCSFSVEDTDHEVKQPSGGNDLFMPVFKSCTLGSSGTTYKLNEKDHEFGVTGGSPCTSRAARKSGGPPLHKALPEQMKVFKGDDSNCQPTSPVNGRMLYTSSTNNSSKLAFPGSLFPPESSPRHYHKALNISEPFAVSVPLRVSAVINSNSTPCRAQDKDEAALLFQKPNRKASVTRQDNNGRNRSVCSNASSLNYITLGQYDLQATAKSTRSGTSLEPTEGHDTEQKECIGTVLLNSEEELNELSGPLPTPYLHFVQPASTTTSGDPETRQSTLTPIQLRTPHAMQSSMPLTQLQNQLKQHQDLEELTQGKKCIEEENGPWPILHLVPKIIEPDITKDKTESTYKAGELTKTTGNHGKQKCTGAIFSGEKNDLRNIVVTKPMEERQKSLDLPDKVDENTWQRNSEDSEQVEPWEDCSTTKQWVTSPLHSLKTFDFLLKSEELTLCLMGDINKGKDIVDSFNTSMRTVPSVRKIVHKCPNLKGQSVENLQNPENRAEAKSVGRLTKTLEQKSNHSFLKPKKQKSQDTLDFEKIKETTPLKHKRPYSLNLDQGMSHIEKLGQHAFPDIFLNKRASIAIVETKYNRSSFELEMFLTDRQTAMRRNSAPISVSSIRTSFIVKTCQAKSVPVIAPKMQYCQIPQALQLKKPESSQENEQENLFAGSRMGVLHSRPALTSNEMEFDKPLSKIHRHVKTCNSFEMCKATFPADKPVLRWKPDSKEEASNNSARFEKSTTLQRQSLRTRPNRPQSLILFSALFPFTDHPPLGDSDKLPLSSIKNNSETTASQCSFNKEADGNVKNPDVVTLHSKLTMPKSGQRLETSMSCFYQPHRRSMISDSKSNRQID
ncbi:hypothetical protein ANANG_G00160890, partial [Anguilla anguilla]